MTLVKINSCKGFIVSLIKLQVLRTASILKRDSNTGFFLWILWIIQEHLFCIESMNGWFLNTSASFWKHFIASDRFRFRTCNFIKNETPAKFFICDFCKIFKNISWQNFSKWLFLVFICEFWEVFQITSFLEHL